MLIVVQASTVRQRTEDLERASLSTWASLAAETKGRDRFEEPDPYRTAFQQDRDRLLHSHAFRRLRDKTHAFITTETSGERYRVRLTHTLEVGQIGRTIARGLRLNEDLVEAIATGHDLGHTPFGAAGEEALAAFTDPPFRHHEQSLRVVEQLERNRQGLNLTWEVRDGILHHTAATPWPATAEGQVVRLANRIAVLTHDLDDALRVGLLRTEVLPKRALTVLGRTHSQRVATLVGDAITASQDQPEVRMSPRVHHVQRELATVLVRYVHQRPDARAEHDRALHCLSSLVVYHLENPAALPPDHQHGDPVERRVLDFVSSLGDQAALAAFSRVFLPSAEASWPRVTGGGP